MEGKSRNGDPGPEYRRRAAAEVRVRSISLGQPRKSVPLETSKHHHCRRSRPASQNSSAQIQSASIITSHMTVVAETRKIGVNNVRSAVWKGVAFVRLSGGRSSCDERLARRGG